MMKTQNPTVSTTVYIENYIDAGAYLILHDLDVATAGSEYDGIDNNG